MSDAWLWDSASDLGRGIDAGRIDPVALTDIYLEAAAEHADRDRIYARLTPARARAEARAAQTRARAGQRRGLLDGVPVSWKDLFDTAGVATEAGSALLAGRVPAHDAAALRQATSAGLICLGKTHMSELAFSGLGLNPVTGTPPNRNDPAAVPGGSSSGAAASVAFGLAAAAVGSDTGGSVRIPAAWNDLVGLKTGMGRIDATGSVALCEKFDTIGPLCRTVEDAARMLAALAGGRAADLRGATLSGVRLMVLETVAMEDLRDAPAAGFERAVQALQTAGATVTRRAIPEIAEAVAMSGILFTSEAYAIWRDVIEAAPEKMFPRILERFRSGGAFSAADYVAAWRRLEQIRAIYRAQTAGFDAVIIPTAPNMPPEVARLMSDADYFVAENLMTLRNTRIGNLMGGASLTLPTGVPSTGILFLGGAGQEERLLRLGAAAEAALR